MTIFDMIRAQLAKTVPFAAHVGVEIVAVANGEATARLEQTPTSINHIASQHAGALFTLGEAASGAAMAGAFAARLAAIRPVAGSAEIRYTRVAKGTITARATIDQDVDGLTAKLDAEGRIAFDVHVTMTDEAGEDVANMKVAWHLKKLA
jgi:acyl-coenzyme A thioesterase PaaI-like protein